ncbi:hypothetical protein [Christiangramia portivictoriae]|uniref:hypothetical protein n=1 Tax=Christiangramia portivictoriae TaxID=326069 RepID=UPI00040F9A2D|nr:hypothetical protein [Christiangramia portivictoriae]
MKKQITLLVLAISFFTISCSSEDDGFEEANENAAKRYVTKIITTGEGESTVSEINYDSQGRVISASSDNETKFFSYNDNGDGSLSKVSGGGDNIMTDEIIGEIQEAYEIGDVLQYDKNGNPSVLELYDEDYEGNQIISIATITYDDKPFTFYYTLDAAGIIDVLYDVRLQFYAPQEIVMAKKLLPVNNPVRAIITDESNQEIGSITVDYNYDEFNYPETTTVVAIDDEGYAESYNVIYQYR